MGNLNLDIKNMRNKANAVIDKNKSYKESIDTVVNSLLNADTVWKDNATPTFLEIVKDDLETFNELDSSINKNIELSIKFCDYLQTSISGYFGVSTLNNIKYISGITSRAVETLDIIKTRTTNVKSSVASLHVPFGSAYSTTIGSLVSDIDFVSLDKTKGKIQAVIDAIDKVITSVKYDASRIDNVVVDDKLLDFSSKTLTPELKREEEYDRENASVSRNTTAAVIDNSGFNKEHIDAVNTNVTSSVNVDGGESVEVLDDYSKTDNLNQDALKFDEFGQSEISSDFKYSNSVTDVLNAEFSKNDNESYEYSKKANETSELRQFTKNQEDNYEYSNELKEAVVLNEDSASKLDSYEYNNKIDNNVTEISNDFENDDIKISDVSFANKTDSVDMEVLESSNLGDFSIDNNVQSSEMEQIVKDDNVLYKYASEVRTENLNNNE